MSSISALGRQRQRQRQKQVDFCEFEASLVYRASSKTARLVTQRNPTLKKTKIKGKFILPRVSEKL